nr:unnamed protein product [Spirometra erinaceieuropaei]
MGQKDEDDNHAHGLYTQRERQRIYRQGTRKVTAWDSGGCDADDDDDDDDDEEEEEEEEEEEKEEEEGGGSGGGGNDNFDKD